MDVVYGEVHIILKQYVALCPWLSCAAETPTKGEEVNIKDFYHRSNWVTPE